MSYESIEQATATLTRLEQLKLLTYLANLLKESEERDEKTEKKTFQLHITKAFSICLKATRILIWKSLTIVVTASVALSHNATIVTHNIREFSRVKGLRVEDWTI